MSHSRASSTPRQGDGVPIDVRPDVAEFEALVCSRERGDTRAAKLHLAALRQLGWSICAIEPRQTGGQS
jgi:hypothetical protein